GRVGRGQQEFLILLVAQPDALDQYFMHHPEDFFGRGYERAVADPYNPEVLKRHLVCAAAELPLREGETAFDLSRCRPALQVLEQEGRLLQDISGAAWYATERNPQRRVDLRGTGEGYSILEEGSRAPIGRIDGIRAFSECHPGAIYLHRARQYLITLLDLERREIRARPANESYYTRVLAEKETEILSIERSRLLEPVPQPSGGTPQSAPILLRQGWLKVTERVLGYERRAIWGQELLSTHSLQLPPQIFETVGVWLEIGDPLKADLTARGVHPMGSLHAVEHAMIALFPLLALCDRNDLGGISYILHPQVRQAAIFIYDGYPGGVGLSAQAFERMEALLQSTLQTLDECPCTEGCPSCIHSPKCGSGNRPLDKEGARLFLRRATGAWPPPEEKRPEPASPASPVAAGSPPVVGESPPAPQKANGERGKQEGRDPRLLYFDLETQKSAEEVGGWGNTHLMRLACGVVYDSRSQRFHSFQEEEVHRLVELLAEGDLVVGFNIIRFDYGVLRGYTGFDFSRLKTFDLLVDIQRRLGFRLSLDHLASRTLQIRKLADGLQSLRWFKAGEIDKVITYCRKDVEITRDLFLFGLKNRYLVFERREGGLARLPVDWDLEQLLVQEAPSPRQPFPR
ncbi:MAG: DUF1998 domain-containing protein, partial [Candidatus Tectomicrobia bacterium]|nr:DUF1998 domain-containing protein [Candidatus Tectomicrobia bacterium]